MRGESWGEEARGFDRMLDRDGPRTMDSRYEIAALSMQGN